MTKNRSRLAYAFFTIIVLLLGVASRHYGVLQAGSKKLND